MDQLERMMQQYGDMLVRLCAALIKDQHLAQDVVQETFLRAWRHMDSLRDPKSEKAWLCCIAINLCRDQQRTRWLRMVEKRADVEPLAKWCTPPDEQSTGVMEAIAQLKPRYRALLVLHYLEDMSAEELGRSLGLSASAVYSRLKKAKAQLKELLEGWESDE